MMNRTRVFASALFLGLLAVCGMALAACNGAPHAKCGAAAAAQKPPDDLPPPPPPYRRGIGANRAAIRVILFAISATKHTRPSGMPDLEDSCPAPLRNHRSRKNAEHPGGDATSRWSRQATRICAAARSDSRKVRFLPRAELDAVWAAGTDRGPVRV